ncbi:DNA sulfur modification protein DndD [Fictibacillus nanhaiensis]|uniref:DNA sulfur modification protein DndD n=1 Tax=Fictibacillus nanhaiensis TaxID=742169 RepID=UPI001C97769A|nr:DNA sulfur modification protein DndD [Fictibacillus nanhaiensis]MBY6036646.1 DNA sulfur modification protein DndD [Fictibacillus nanhaiensis]
MLFKKLLFDNYKTYYGHQEVEFYIPQEVRQEEKKNIILLGGLNGAGKTTILKAIHYILFGKRGITETEHKRLFSNVINNTFYEEGGRDCSATLILENDNLEEWELKVTWSFNQNKILINENRDIVVRKPGARHGKHAQVGNIEAFNRIIDRIIPYHAAPFFIFDGEEIKDIILRQNSEEMKNAIQKISGMDAYKQLLIDLYSVQKDLENKLTKSVSSAKLLNIKKELETVYGDIEKVENRKKVLLTEKNKLKTRLDDLKVLRNKKISANSKSREEVVKKQTKINTELEIQEKEFANHFNEHVTNIILKDKISNLKKRLKVENDTKQQQIINEASLKPYHSFINQLLNKSVNPPLTSNQLEQIKKLGEEIWVKENKVNKKDIIIEVIHDIAPNDYSLIVNTPIRDKHVVTQLINSIEKKKNDINHLETEIRNAPEAADYSSESNMIEIYTREFGKLELKLKSVMQKFNTLNEQKANLLNQVTRHTSAEDDTDQVASKLEYTKRLVIVVEQFVKQSTLLKANYIREEFSNMLSKLFRKQEEFSNIDFDINSYTIKLFNDRGQQVSIQDRSAGEMQMISSALIWALTKASDLSLPMVIDTPLGRLDSHHRNHLINHYYKELSEQVIILSTDTEITDEYVKLMKNNSYKQYMLDYDEKKKYTIIRDGYFNFVKV